MKDLQTPILTDTWVTATWDEYIQLVSNPIYDKAKCYYHQGGAVIGDEGSKRNKSSH